MTLFVLYITHAATGYVQVQTFPTRFDRAVEVIQRRDDPVTMRLADY